MIIKYFEKKIFWLIFCIKFAFHRLVVFFELLVLFLLEFDVASCTFLHKSPQRWKLQLKLNPLKCHQLWPNTSLLRVQLLRRLIKYLLLYLQESSGLCSYKFPWMSSENKAKFIKFFNIKGVAVTKKYLCTLLNLNTKLLRNFWERPFGRSILNLQKLIIIISGRSSCIRF